MNILGIDFGLKHLGLALADGPLAEPLPTIPFIGSIPKILSLVAKHHIDLIVVGQADPKLEPAFSTFITSLKTANCKLTTTDETLSSVDARQALLHKTQSGRAELEHSAAAALILQAYLDEEKSGFQI